MKTLAPLLTASLGLAACNGLAPQASPPPASGSALVTPPGFQLPEGTDCSGKIARYPAVQDNDLSMGPCRPAGLQPDQARNRRPLEALYSRPRRRSQVNRRGVTEAARLSDRSLSECVAQIVGDEDRHPRFIDVFRTAHDVHARKLGQSVARQVRLHSRLEPDGGYRERY